MTAGLGAMYGLIIPHMLPDSMHCVHVNAFKGIIKKKIVLEETMDLSKDRLRNVKSSALGN